KAGGGGHCPRRPRHSPRGPGCPGGRSGRPRSRGSSPGRCRCPPHHPACPRHRPGSAGPGAPVSVRIMIAEDQTMVRQALVALLEFEPDITVVAQAASGDEAIAMAGRYQPDVALLDIEIPGLDGIEGASRLTAREAEVLAAARGHGSIADLAGRLHLSQGTVRNDLSAAIQKLGARNRADAVQIAERKGWL